MQKENPLIEEHFSKKNKMEIRESVEEVDHQDQRDIIKQFI